MTTPFTVSMELLAIGNKSFLPLEILGLVETVYKKHKAKEDIKADLGKLTTIIKRNTSITCSVNYQVAPVHFLAVQIPLTLMAHSGAMSGGQEKWILELFIKEGDKLKFKKPPTGTVDLEKVQVNGFFSEFEFTLFITSGIIDLLTPEEFTAALLHEIGHMFTSLALLGEYVWINYLLSDGVDILLNKKKNVYKVDFLNATLPDEKSAQKVVIKETLSRYRELSNPFITTGSYKRSEQLADQFVARLGFGKPLVTALDKIYRGGMERFTDYGPSMLMRTFINTMNFIATPFWIVFFLQGLLIGTLPPSNYDRPKERFIRVKRDLIIQLRNTPSGTALHEQLLADIKAIDVVTSKMDEWDSVMSVLFEYANPITRRSLQKFQSEKQLEALFANDLFVTAAHFKNLIKA